MPNEIKAIELGPCDYHAQCRAKSCTARATIIARSIDTGGRPNKQYELCATHTEQIAEREQAKGHEIVNREIDTTAKQRWPAAIARKAAEELAAELAPRCERIEIAGSLRRGKANVGDIEILYVPRMDQVHVPGELFPKSGSLADELIEDWLARGVLTKRFNINGNAAWGALNKLAVHAGSSIPVDLFATTAERWFVSLVVRSGSKEMNTTLAGSALRRGMQLHMYGVLEVRTTGEQIPPSRNAKCSSDSTCHIANRPNGRVGR
jgi:DNA polymerase/3'-5' exonuclease PolX